MLHKNTSQCKILFEPKEGWFGQPKYSTPSKESSYVVSVSAFIFYFLGYGDRKKSKSVNVLFKNLYHLRLKKFQATSTKQDISSALFKIFFEHPRPFYIRVPPGKKYHNQYLILSFDDRLIVCLFVTNSLFCSGIDGLTLPDMRLVTHNSQTNGC